VRYRVAIGVVIFAAVAGAACSEGELREQVSDAAGAATELGIRNVAAVAGTEAFENEGVELRDGLDCEAEADLDSETVSVSCTGETTGGAAAKLRGEVRGDRDGRSVRGSFVGTVDEKVVFEEACLGNDC
jgi:hypothetical protein